MPKGTFAQRYEEDERQLVGQRGRRDANWEEVARALNESNDNVAPGIRPKRTADGVKQLWRRIEKTKKGGMALVKKRGRPPKHIGASNQPLNLTSDHRQYVIELGSRFVKRRLVQGFDYGAIAAEFSKRYPGVRKPSDEAIRGVLKESGLFYVVTEGGRPEPFIAHPPSDLRQHCGLLAGLLERYIAWLDENMGAQLEERKRIVDRLAIVLEAGGVLDGLASHSAPDPGCASLRRSQEGWPSDDLGRRD